MKTAVINVLYRYFQRYDPLVLSKVFLFTTAALYVVFLLYSFSFYLDSNMKDFMAFYTASQMAADGKAVHAYSQELYIEAGDEIFESFPIYAWFYPPTTFLFMTPLAWLPPTVSYYGTLILQPLLIGLIIWYRFRQRAVLFHTMLGGGLLVNFIYGQLAGFWTLFFALGLFALQKKEPVRAGIWFTLLSLKPHYGLMLPIALMAAKQWRCIATICAGIGSLVITSVAAYGIESWEAFWENRTLTQLAINDVKTFFGSVTNEMASLFATMRFYGFSDLLTWGLYGIIISGCAFTVWRSWRSADLDTHLKSAVLLGATIVCAPWLFGYDLVLMNLWTAFMVMFIVKTLPEQYLKHYLPITIVGLVPIIIIVSRALSALMITNLLLFVPIAYTFWLMRVTGPNANKQV